MWNWFNQIGIYIKWFGISCAFTIYTHTHICLTSAGRLVYVNWLSKCECNQIVFVFMIPYAVGVRIDGDVVQKMREYAKRIFRWFVPKTSIKFYRQIHKIVINIYLNNQETLWGKKSITHFICVFETAAPSKM